jgi:BirA family biotin operon repressor/biotin-[acetyl-CoA-carboxylase] ligase
MTPWPDGYDRLILDRTDSTMAEAARRAPGLTASTWILAHHQTAAHGRRGRPWAMPPGNFAATLVMQPTEPPAQVALRSFVTALALYDAFAAVTGQTAPFALKWPNDVLLNGGKVAGILLQSFGPARTLAIGIGVNLAQAPGTDAVEADALRPVSLAQETGARVSPASFLAALASAYAAREASFATYGFAPIRTAWLARAAKLGEPITARTGSETLTGVFETIDDAGHLILSTSTGRRAIPAADVFF